LQNGNDSLFGYNVYVIVTSSMPDLPQPNHFESMVTFHAISMKEQLLMIGDGILYEYEYLNNDIRLISQLQRN